MDSSIVILREVSITNEEFENSGYQVENSRTLDSYTKKILYTVDRLSGIYKYKFFVNDTGIAIATSTGPFSSIKNMAEDLSGNDYRKINPSFFTNVMSSTALSYLAKYLKVHGPTCSFFISKENNEDIDEYVATQLLCGNCKAMIEIYADDGGCSWGKYVIRKDLIHEDSIY